MSETPASVLVVDDEIQIRRFLRTGFELDGFMVHEAETGAEALRTATLQPSDLPRFAVEGVVASMQAQQMMWLHPDRTDNWSVRLGDDRCDRAFLIRSLRESGATIALGSDWPVARFDPRLRG